MKSIYYKIKYAIKNLIDYFPVVIKQRHYDYAFILIMIKFELQLLYKSMKKYSLEVEEDKNKKLNDIQRTISLLDDFIKDKYLFNNIEYKKKWNELFELLKKMDRWWY